MNLGIDATILYYLGSWSATIHQSDIDSHEPYNTRVNPGLPPTPICNPGLASLQAAAHPADVSYLYYVAVPGQAAQYFAASYSDSRRMAADPRRAAVIGHPIAHSRSPAIHAAAYGEPGSTGSTWRSTCAGAAGRTSSRGWRRRASRA